MKVLWAATVLMMTVTGSSVEAAQESDAAASLPTLSVTLKPHSSNGRVDYVDGSVTIGSPQVAAGGTLVRMPLVIVSIPTARYDGDALKASDAKGELRLTQKDEEPTPTGTYRQWLASRATSGDVTVKFRAPPRVITPTTRTGPLFDLRADGGGVLGAGITFIPLPDSKQPYRLSLRWDLGDMPAGSRGVGSLGDGNVDTIGPPERLAFSFYAAGPMKSVPQAGSNDFGMYWFSDLPFDATALARSIEQLYGYMAKFFHDEGQPYRVFIRKNVNRLGGGTALPQSFMFGWNEEKSPTIEQLQSLLAHEMTHNWPALQGDHGDTAWYSEGAAEFYSTVLSSRAGVLSPSQTLEEINRHAFDYYTNPYLHSSNREVAKVFWTDWSAQRVPYGRGFMYLAQVDAQIRERSGGKRSLDDIVVELFRQKKAGKVPGIDEWLRLVQAEIGERAQSDYDAMVAGRVIVPPPNTFAPCFKPVTDRARPFALGLSSNSFAGERKVVEGLVSGGPAADAGLREGDEIVEFTDPLEVQKDPGMHMKIKVRRDGQEISIDYLPRGPEIEIYRWQRAAGVSDANCKV